MSALARGKAFINKNHIVVGNFLVRPSAHSSAVIRSRRTIHVSSKPVFKLAQSPLFVTPKTFPSVSPTPLIANQLLLTPQVKNFASSTYQTKTVLLPNEVDTSKFILGAPKKNSKGGQFIPVNYGGEFKTLRVQTPIARSPFGLQSYEASGGYSIQIALENLEGNPTMNHFVNMIQKVDEMILAEALKNNKIWFAGKNYTPEIIKNNFTRNVKEGKEGFSPLMKFKIPVSKGQPDVEVYMESEAAPIEALEPPNNQTVAIIEPRSIWFVGGKFGISWVVRQIKVLERKNRLPSNAFREDVPELQNRSKVAPVSPNPRPPVVTDVEKEIEADAIEDLNVQSVEAEFIPADLVEAEPEYPSGLDDETVLGEEEPKEIPIPVKTAPKIQSTPQKLTSSPPKPASAPLKSIPPVKTTPVTSAAPTKAVPTKAPVKPSAAPVKPTAAPTKPSSIPTKPASAPVKTAVPPTKAAPTKAASPIKKPLK